MKTNLPDSNEAAPPKRGRKHGSNDSVYISLATLLEHAKPDTVVPVRRKWLERFEEFHNVKFIKPAPKEVGIFNEIDIKTNDATEKEAEVRTRLLLKEEEL